MSIDAQIYALEQTDAGLRLKLMPRTSDNHAGQRSLTIVNPTWTPPLDTQLWGDDTYIYVAGESKPRYRRIGYTRLQEIPK